MVLGTAMCLQFSPEKRRIIRLLGPVATKQEPGFLFVTTNAQPQVYSLFCQKVFVPPAIRFPLTHGEFVPMASVRSVCMGALTFVAQSLVAKSFGGLPQDKLIYHI